MAVVSAQDVREVYFDGVAAIREITGRMSDSAWDSPACGTWTSTQTARHLLSVSRWYHDWLDRAIAGDVSRPFQGSDIDRENDETQRALLGVSGEEAIERFVESASSYWERAEEHWDLPFGYPFGIATVGLHLGVAAAEWHLHSWDLSTVDGQLHRPADPAKLFIAAGLCVARARGGIVGAGTRRLVGLGSRVAPWRTMLKRSGRDPGGV